MPSWPGKVTTALSVLSAFCVVSLLLPQGDGPLRRSLQNRQLIETPKTPEFLFDVMREEGDGARTEMIGLLKTVAQRNMELSETPPPPKAPSSSEPFQRGKPELNCPEGQIPHRILFSPKSVPRKEGSHQHVATLANGNKVTIRSFGTNDANPSSWVSYFQHLYFGGRIPIRSSVQDDGNGLQEFPDSYCTMEIVFENPVDQAFVSIERLESFGTVFSQAVRFRSFDGDRKRLPEDYYKSDPDTYIMEDFAYKHPSSAAASEGMKIGLLPRGKVGTLAIDHTLVAFDPFYLGRTQSTAVQITLEICSVPDLEYGGTDWAVPMTPVSVFDSANSLLQQTPTPTDTPPELVETTAIARVLPVVEKTEKDPFHGDLLLKTFFDGKPFFFNAHSGGWYSAVSTSAFQWNMHVQKFEGCPSDSDTFMTGMGLVLYGRNREKLHTLEISVVKEFNTDVACGHASMDKARDYSCLGAGSLELVVDGRKISKAMDYQFPDGTGRVLAYNTVGKCSRSWFAPSVVTASDGSIRNAVDVATGLTSDATKRGRRRRRLSEGNNRHSSSSIFGVLEGSPQTMMSLEGCEQWMLQRKEEQDLWKQTGTWSTIIIQTDKVAFHLEYKQEQERCHAHNLDAWISAVDSSILQEEWRGVIGETKPPDTRNDGEHHTAAGPVGGGDQYEVLMPFSDRCPACIER